jgi:ATP-dependent DNA ligase
MTVTRELRRRLRADRPLPCFEPCLPRPAKEPPAGSGWIHEIKHDGFRIIAPRDAAGVRVITRGVAGSVSTSFADCCQLRCQAP